MVRPYWLALFVATLSAAEPPPPPQPVASADLFAPESAGTHSAFKRSGDRGDLRSLPLGAPKSAATAGKPEAWPLVIGESRAAALEARSADARTFHWRAADDGYVASIEVESKGASALRVGLRMQSPASRVEARAGSRAEWEMGAKVHAIRLDQAAGGIAWTPVTAGDRQVVELWSGEAAPPVVVIENVSHLTTNPLLASERSSLAKELSCHQNYACATDPVIAASGKAVAKLVITSATGQSFVCSGALLNDRTSSLTPWFATADHCGITSASVAANLQFIWNFEVGCSTGIPVATTTTIGSQLLFTDAGVDFTLLRITGALPGGLRFLGWNPAEMSTGTPVVGIHHPAGTFKRVSGGSKVDQVPVSFRGSGTQTWTISANQVGWQSGVTEGGSSGSPLLSSDGAYRGALSAGPLNASCSTATTSFYSRFSQVYPRIRAWIDPAAPTADDWADSAAQSLTLQATPFDTTTQSGVINSATDQDWFRFELPQQGILLLYTSGSQGSSTNTYGRVYGSNGTTLLDENDNDPSGQLGVNFVFFARAAPGRYFLQVTGAQGSTGPYVLNSLFVPDDDHSDFYFLGTALPTPGTLQGAISRSGDSDYFVVNVATQGTLTLSSGGSTDLVGYLYDANHQLIDSNDDIGPSNLNFQIQRSVAPGRYYLRVLGFDVDTRGSYSVTATLSGSSSGANATALWWNPNESGWGVNLNHQGSILFATVFTYAADRLNMWLVGSALSQQADGSYSGALYRTTGPPFNRVPWTSINLTQVGTITVRFMSAGLATLTYSVNGVSVSKSIQKQEFGTPPTCTFGTGSRAAETNYQDLWWNPQESGWGINLAHQGNTIFATLFTYDSGGRDMWLVASGMPRQFDGSYAGALFLTEGPPFNVAPWSAISLAQVGEMTLRFQNGESGTLTYSAFGVNVTKSIQRQVFGTTVPVCR